MNRLPVSRNPAAQSDIGVRPGVRAWGSTGDSTRQVRLQNRQHADGSQNQQHADGFEGGSSLWMQQLQLPIPLIPVVCDPSFLCDTFGWDRPERSRSHSSVVNTFGHVVLPHVCDHDVHSRSVAAPPAPCG
uniref:Uncharacterized protein n=1 Tax=Cryptomonas curvata TaxID=233186 RepID=A0A7S0M5C8_9CRYP